MIAKLSDSFAEIEYRPIPVKDILREMKDLSALMLDLAYYSIIYNNRDLAKEVFNLERRVDYLELLLILQSSLAVRGVSGAERMISIYRLASSSNKISDAAADIARVVFSGTRLVPPSVNIYDKDEVVTHIVLPDKHEFCGKTLEYIFDKLGVVFEVLAVRRSGKWLFNPQEDFKLSCGDVLIVRGLIENVKVFMESLGKRLPKISNSEVEESKINLCEELLQFRNITQFMVDLAYTALITRSEDIAEKTLELEDYVDRMLEKFEYDVISNPDLSVNEKICAIHIAVASEQIADAAAELAELIVRGVEPHPLITDIFWETDERISVIEMDESDEGKTIDELGYEKKGIKVLAVRRNDEWHIMPPYSAFKVKKGDVLIVKYPAESEEYVESLESEEDREEIVEEIQEEEWED